MITLDDFSKISKWGDVASYHGVLSLSLERERHASYIFLGDDVVDEKYADISTVNNIRATSFTFSERTLVTLLRG